MICKKEFITIIDQYIDWLKNIEQVSDIIGIENPYELNWIGYATILFRQTISVLFNENGVNDIDWWIYERDPEYPECQMWVNDKEVPTKTSEDLWNIVKDNRK